MATYAHALALYSTGVFDTHLNREQTTPLWVRFAHPTLSLNVSVFFLPDSVLQSPPSPAYSRESHLISFLPPFPLHFPHGFYDVQTL